MVDVLEKVVIYVYLKSLYRIVIWRKSLIGSRVVTVANDNLKNDIVQRTNEVWKPRLGRELSGEDARQIAANVSGFFSVLAEWSRAEQPTPANDNAELGREGGRVTSIVDANEGKTVGPNKGPTATRSNGMGPSLVACSGSVGDK